MGYKSAVLIQNAFPTLERYADHAHYLDNGKQAKAIDAVSHEILTNFNQMLKLKNKGIELFFTDIDKIKKQMEEELFSISS